MAQFKSPGLETRERFIGGSVRDRPTGRAGIVGSFEWGPVYTITTIASTNELQEVFGRPNDDNYNDYFNAYNYLTYASDLRVVRVINEDEARNASPVFDNIDYTIESGGTNYSIGDTIRVLYEDNVIEDGGRVTRVGSNGEIEAIHIPSFEIIKRMKSNGQYPNNTVGWEIEIDQATLGIGGIISLRGIENDSHITIINSDFAVNALDSQDFGKITRKYNLPRITAKYAGDLGNSIEIEIISYDRFLEEQRGEVTIYPYGITRPMYARDYFRYGPENENQYAVVVYVNSEMRETHIVSTDPKDVNRLSGKSIYMDSYFDVGSSEYIVMSAKDFPQNFSGVLRLGGGKTSSGEVTSASYIRGLDILRDDESVRINTLIAGGVANKSPDIATTVQKYASTIGEVNQDLVVVVDPLVEDVVGLPSPRNIVDRMYARRGSDEENNLNINSTYTVFTGNWALQYDPFNNVNRWVSLAGDMAGLMAQADNRSTPAQSPAGTEFGVIQNKIKLAFNPNKTLRDRLTTVSINPVISFEEGSGFMFYADLTASYEQSHFDHINNRRVSNYLKELFKDLGRSVLFKNNTPHTRLNFKTTGEGLLKNLSGNTIEFGRVWCDHRNNPDDVVFRKEFVATIYYKPLNSINYVILNFVSVESDVQIEEDIVSGTAPF